MGVSCSSRSSEYHPACCRAVRMREQVSTLFQPGRTLSYWRSSVNEQSALVALLLVEAAQSLALKFAMIFRSEAIASEMYCYKCAYAHACTYPYQSRNTMCSLFLFHTDIIQSW